MSSVSIEKALWKDMEQRGVILGNPGSGRSGMLGKSKYDHTMGGSQGSGGRVRGSGAPPGQRKAQGPPTQSTLSLQMGKPRLKVG